MFVNFLFYFALLLILLLILLIVANVFIFPFKPVLFINPEISHLLTNSFSVTFAASALSISLV